MTLVILAAGLGSRYGGLKQLDPMTAEGEFIIDFSVFDAARAGFDKVVFVIKPENEAIFRETIGERIAADSRVKVEYAYQTLETSIPEGCTVPEGRVKPLGTGHALLCAKEQVGGDNLAVINADDFYGADAFGKLADFLRAGKGEDRFAMAGFVLRKTLTEHGSVSRGVCETDERGILRTITERTKIYRDESGRVVFEEEGVLTPLDENCPVSMNCWAFTPAIFAFLKEGLRAHLEALASGEKDPMKAEFYLPFCVDDAMKAGKCAVEVLRTESDWRGVTYPEDKEAVKAALKALKDAGEYPAKLWN